MKEINDETKRRGTEKIIKILCALCTLILLCEKKIQFYLIIKFGRKVAIEGKAINSAISIKILYRKGHIPLKMVSSGMSCETPLMIKKFIPTGGVASAKATTRTIMTPNQIGS